MPEHVLAPLICEPEARDGSWWTREQAIKRVAKVLLAEGAGADNSIHSWRCQYEQYGECTCVADVAAEVVAALLGRGESDD